RTIQVEKHTSLGLMLRIFDVPDARQFEDRTSQFIKLKGPNEFGNRPKIRFAVVERENGVIAAALIGFAEAAEWQFKDGGLRLRLPPAWDKDSSDKILVWAGTRSELHLFEKLVEKTALPLDLKHSTKEYPSRYPNPVITKGTLGTESGAYVVDTLT